MSQWSNFYIFLWGTYLVATHIRNTEKMSRRNHSYSYMSADDRACMIVAIFVCYICAILL